MRNVLEIEVLESFGARGRVLNELHQYCSHVFQKMDSIEQPDEANPQIEFYESMLLETNQQGFEVLKKHLVQLQFPVKEGISQTEIYKDVVLRGKSKSGDYEMTLIAPDQIKLIVYSDDLIGKVPVLIVPDKSDFSTIVCALTNKNEPKPIPSSMGAAFIKGINNWSRIHQLKREWLDNNPLGSWSQEFRVNILPCHRLYQDQLIVLSEQPYSNVTAEKLGLAEEVWKSYSVEIRLAHECAHLFTLREYGKMENHIFDELIADYVGITSALGYFDLNWFLHFMGLEDPKSYREGGRFQNYLPNLSNESGKILQKILVAAAQNLYEFDAILTKKNVDSDRRKRIKSICETGLLDLASEFGIKILIDKHATNEMTFSRH